MAVQRSGLNAIQNSIVCLSYNPRFVTRIINVYLLVTDLLPFTEPVESSASGILKLDSSSGSYYLIGC
jgi:hypothetical protein